MINTHEKFLCKKDTFGGSPDAIAWMDVPKPYREVI